MRRWLKVLAAGVVLWHLGGDTAWAQVAPFPQVNFQRGPGLYLNWFKIALGWLDFFLWVATTEWANVDAQRYRLNYLRWNLLLVFPYLGLFVASWLIPIYWVSLPLLLLAHWLPLGFYVRHRNQAVEPHERVLTADHLRFLIAERLNSIGFNLQVERKAGYEAGPPLELVPTAGANEQDNQAKLILARQSPAFVLTKELLADAMANRADAVMMDFTAQEVGVRYQIDGVWHNGDNRDRETGDAILVVLKTLAHLNPAERRARQQGDFQIKVEKAKTKLKVASQGTKTGERVALGFDDGKLKFPKLADLSMREKLVEQLKLAYEARSGLILVSALPGGGLTSTFDALVNSTDRYLRSFAGIEELNHKERAIENVVISTYDPAHGESPATIMPKLVRTYPDAIVCRNLPDAASIDVLCDQVAENRLIITSIRARDTSEALLRVLALGVDPLKFAGAVTAVVNERLIRKLCEHCREAVPPPPQVLKQLGIPQGKIEAFYRPPENPEKPCPECSGVGYFGRTAFFEVMIVGDEVRQALTQSPKLDVIRQVARKAGMRTLQEEGLLLVAKGITSLTELSRVLKE